MQPINDLAANLQSTLPRAAPEASSSGPGSAAESLDLRTLVDLWLANVAAYGPKWTSRAGDLPMDDDGALTIAGGVWARGLAGIPRAAVLDALERHARVNAWPAELSELRALCLGVPSLAEVKLILLRDEPQKPAFVVLVFQHLDYYAWRMADQRGADRMLADAYATARDHVLLSGALPKVKAQLAAPEQRAAAPASPEAVRHHLETIRNELAASSPAIRVSTVDGEFDVPAAAPVGKDAAAGPDA